MNLAEYNQLIKTMTLQQRADFDRKLQDEKRKKHEQNNSH
jgi:hypothetical protein